MAPNCRNEEFPVLDGQRWDAFILKGRHVPAFLRSEGGGFDAAEPRRTQSGSTCGGERDYATPLIAVR